MEDFSDIIKWYSGKSIFVTGGTGFMGKVLIEKLLRTCNVKKIYCLIRPKKNVDVQLRLDQMLSFKLFDTIRENNNEDLKKVVAIKGDITYDGLGISEDDVKLISEEVSIVFHVAATINFQEPMRVAVNMNILGTKRVVELSKNIKNLEALVHVSTAYGNCHLTQLTEEMYPTPIEPNKLIKMTEWLNDDELETLTPKLIHPRPNTYTYTKAIAEHILADEAQNLPSVIIRPTIVCGAWREPTPGWVDNLFAFTGLLVVMGKGFLRSLYLKPGIKVDFIPVDIPINLMVAAAWNTAKGDYKPEGKVPIYCACSSSEKPLTIDKLEPYLRKIVWRVPQDSPIWFPDGSKKTSKFMHDLHIYVVNIIPCYLADLVLKLLGKKQIAMKLCNRMLKAINVLEYFMLREWTFSNDNVRKLWNSLSPLDQKNFHFDISELEWPSYIEQYQVGCKKFILKEDIENLPKAKRNLRFMYWIHRIFQLFLLYGAWCIASSETAVDFYSTAWDTVGKMMRMAPALVAAEENFS